MAAPAGRGRLLRPELRPPDADPHAAQPDPPPQTQRIGGKDKACRTRNGSKSLRTGVTEAPRAAARTKASYLSAHHARIRGCRGPGKATVATAYSILVAPYYMLRRELPYQDLGADDFHRRQQERTER